MICGAIIDEHLKAATVAKLTGLKQKQVNKWVNRKLAYKGFNHLTWRPRLVKAIEAAQKKSEAMNFGKNFHEEAKQSRNRRNFGRNVSEPSRASFSRYKIAIEAKVVDGQNKTTARRLAEADPRNSFTEFIMFEAFQMRIAPFLIINFDATQYFSVNGEDSFQRVLHIEKTHPFLSPRRDQTGLTWQYL